MAKNLEALERARRIIPGITQLISKRPDRFSEGVWPGYYSRAEGCRITDLDGTTYIDMSISGIGANVLGYADADVDEAVIQSIRDGSSSSLNCTEELELAELLCEIHPWADMARFTRAGGEAMAVATRIARAHSGRDVLAVCGYHGWHDWYISANLGKTTALDGHLLPGLSPVGVPRSLEGSTLTFGYNDIDRFRAVIGESGQQIAAVVMEPMRNDEPAAGFLEEIREETANRGICLIFDEISSGFRGESGGLHLRFGIKPDIAVFSKALGNGYPIAAIIGTASVMRAAENSFISSTTWTERVGPAAAIACVKKHRRLVLGPKLEGNGQKVQDIWANCAAQAGLELQIGGYPPLSHFRFTCGAHAVLKAYFIQIMLTKGYLASDLYYAMAAHGETEITGYAAAVKEAFAEIRDALDKGDISERLIGSPAAEGFKRLI